ncbi:MAG: Hsp33 family molecular chaperone HslO [Victivallaceae bacterium]
MHNIDFLLRGILKRENIRFIFAETTSTVRTGILIHDTDPVAGKVFSEALTAGVLISPLLENKEKYSIRWEYPGAISSILVDINALCDIRGIIKNPQIIDKINNPDDILGEKDGFISIIKSEEGKILNSGKTKAALGDPAADVAFFFSVSDQIETEISVEVSFNSDPVDPVKISAGFMLQAMPGCDYSALDEYRKNINSQAFRQALLKEQPTEKKLWELLSVATGKAVNSLNKDNLMYEFGVSPGFRCNCSFEKMRTAMSVLDKQELEKLFQEKESPTITCQFCKTSYCFKKTDFC